MGLTDLVVDAGVEEDALGGGGLTGIDVRHDADVADLLQVGQRFNCHWVTPLISLLSGPGARHLCFVQDTAGAAGFLRT